MRAVVVDRIFEPLGRCDLIRLGRDNDGGYLVERNSIENSAMLLSFGINDDWSFEKSFYQQTGAQIQAFDGSLDYKLLTKNLMIAIPQVNKPNKLFNVVKSILTYKLFFRADRSHHAIMVGYDGEGSRTLSSVFEEFVVDKVESVFLKVDIEGWEYRIMDDLIRYADFIEGLVIEFHDIDLHFNRIKEFLEKLPLKICHCHANNFGGVDPSNHPLILEVSFSKERYIEAGSVILPHGLDMPNWPSIGEYKISFCKDLPNA